MMATYYGVTAVRRMGRKYMGWSDFTGETMPQPPIPDGKRLIAFKRDAHYEVACDVTLAADWEELLQAYVEIAFATCEFYLIDDDLLSHCPDEGRVQI